MTGDILQITQGNTLLLCAVILTDQLSEVEIPLSECTDVRIRIVSRLGHMRTLDFARDETETGVVTFRLPADLPCDTYDFEISGSFGNQKWRGCEAGILKVVPGNEGANLWAGSVDIGEIHLSVAAEDPEGNTRLNDLEERVADIEDELTIA